MWRTPNPGFSQLVAGTLFVLIAGSAILFTTLTGGNRNEPSGTLSLGQRLALYEFGSGTESWRSFAVEGAAFGWNGRDRALFGEVQVNRGYVVTVNTARTFSNTSVTVRLQSASLPDNTTLSAGLVCRGDVNGNGYYFLVADSGRASIQAGDPSNPDDLIMLADWTPAPSLLPLTDENLLTAVCAADYLALSINGEFVVDVRDSRFDSGLLGVTLAGGLSAGADGASLARSVVGIQFDDVVVTEALRVGGR